MKKRIILTISSFFILVGCSVLNNTPNYGFITTSVKFPNKNFNIKVIPNNTALIIVEVFGNGLVNPLKFELTKTESRKTLEGVPIGSKSIQIKALDDKGKILAQGISVTNIEGGKNTVVEVTLNAISEISTNNNVTPVKPIDQINDETNSSSDSNDNSDSSDSSDSSSDNTSNNDDSDQTDETDETDVTDQTDETDETDYTSDDSNYSGSSSSNYIDIYEEVTINITTKNGAPKIPNQGMSISVPSSTPSPR